MVSSSGYTVSVSVFQGAPPPLGEGAASSGEDVYYAGRSTVSTTFWKFIRRIFGAWNAPAAGAALHAERPSRYPELPWASPAHDSRAGCASIQWHPHRRRALPRAGMQAVGRTLRAAEPRMQRRWRGAAFARPTAHAPARSTDSPARGADEGNGVCARARCKSLRPIGREGSMRRHARKRSCDFFI